MNFYKILIRPLLFCFDSEKVHDFLIRFLSKLWKFTFAKRLTHALYCSVEAHPVQLCGLNFKNAVGLAAGFDKNALIAHGVEHLGFGFAEIGTVTPRPQDGNPKPRIFRETYKEALINRMGFPNQGLHVVYENYIAAKKIATIPLGVNIGKNKDTPNSHAILDYETLLHKFSGAADYFTINISSPNTPGLRALQSLEFLEQIKTVLEKLQRHTPTFIKLAPEVNEEDLKAFSESINASSTIQGLVLTNTLSTDIGGLSGKPIQEHSLRSLMHARKYLSKDKIIISAGGISDAQDLRTRIQHGANLVQIYTSLIFNGPKVVKNLLQ